MLQWSKVGEGFYRARFNNEETGVTNIFEVKLDKEKDRYETILDGESILEGTDESETGYWYYLKEAKAFFNKFLPETASPDGEVYYEWEKVETREQRGVNLVGTDIQIRLNKKADRYEVIRDGKILIAGIYYMKDAKDLATATYEGKDLKELLAISSKLTQRRAK